MCVVLPIEEQDLGGSSSPVPVTEPQPDLDDQAADKTDHDAVMSSDDRYTKGMVPKKKMLKCGL